MRRSLFLAAWAATCLPSCGKLADKFSRINDSYTRVYLSSRSPVHEASVMPGGFMIFFVNETNAQVGRAFGFPDADTASTKSVVVPNGPYRVYAYAWDGASPFQGQVRCGRGDLGAVVFLTGAPATVTIDMSMPTCNFASSGFSVRSFKGKGPAYHSGRGWRPGSLRSCGSLARWTSAPGSLS